MIQNYHSHQWRLETIIQSYHSFPWCWKIIIYSHGGQNHHPHQWCSEIYHLHQYIYHPNFIIHITGAHKSIIHRIGAQAAYQESSLCCQEPWSSSSQEKSPADASSIVMIL